MCTFEARQGQTPEWKAPHKEYGGEDLQAYYIVMLANEIVSVLVAGASKTNKSIFDQLDKIPVMQGFKEKVEDPSNGADARLKKRGLYFYEIGGSVFMDYKILRNKAFKKVGENLGETDSIAAQIRGYKHFRDQFTIETPLDDVLTKAQDFISKWEWTE